LRGEAMFFLLFFLIIFLVILFIQRQIKKRCPNLPRLNLVGITVLVTAAVFFLTDFILAMCHCGPVFCMPIMFAMDGGSTYFVGLFYHVYKKAAFDLATSPPYFEYNIAPWFFSVMG